MRSILAIYRRELSGYFVSPIAYIVIGIFLLVSGFFFNNMLGYFMQRALMAQMQQMQMGGAAGNIDVPGMVIRSFFGNLAIIILFLLPMLTMGVYAEERKRGTMELLMTSPISELQIAIAKFLGALTLFVVMLLPTLLYIVIMSRYSDPAIDWRVVWSGYLGILLLGSALVAIGTFISSATENQIIAGVITFATFLLLWVLDMGSDDSTSILGSIIQYLSILHHFQDFSRGVIDTTHIVFYLSLVVLSVFLTLRMLDSMRWKRA
jgi:ABC-2 type transport system permease protein